MVERLGRYEIKSELGRGGFGRVYRAFDPVMGRMVAIKALTAEGDADLLIRFRNEAAASGGIRHPNIVTIHDFGEQEGMPYIVMELLEGEDLQRFIAKKKTMSLLDKVRVMSQVAAGLGHAHAHGIIHRDVKPANIMLLHDGSVKIMDFGIALLAKGMGSRLTPHGAIVGTFRYMAPEQFLGAEPDARSDIFSYGLVFYELLAGVHPFHAPEPAALMYNILHLSPVPLRELSPDCPETLEAIVSRLLHRDPDLRYQLLVDALFDCEPVLLELRKAKATELVAHARLLRTETQSEAAQALIHQALELDPTNTAARQLREELQKEFRKRAIQPRIRSLMLKAEEELTAGNFTEAIQQFESALRLDPDDIEVQRALEKAREEFAESRRLEQLLADANQALHAGELTSAQRHGSEAQRIAPSDMRVNDLMKRVQEAQSERQRQRRLRENVDRARRLIEVEAWSESGALLSKLADEFPDDKEIAALHVQAKLGKDEQERQLRLSDGLNKARDEIQAAELECAVDRLQRLAAEFSGSSELQHLLSIAESERRGQLRRQLIERTTGEAEAFLLKDQFSEARECIEAALNIYPNEPVLERELRAIETAARTARRRAALQQALKSAETLRFRKRLKEALQVLEAFLEQYGAERSVEELRSSLEAEIEEERRAVELRQIVRHAKDLSSHENVEPAVEFLKQSVSRFQHQPQLLDLLSAAETKLEEQRKRALVADLLSDNKARMEAGDFEGAIHSLEAGLTKFPDDQELLKQRADAVRMFDAKKRVETIRIATAEANMQIQHGDFGKASEIIAAASSKYPDSQALATVQDRIEALRGELAASKSPTADLESSHATSPHSKENLPKGTSTRGESASHDGSAAEPVPRNDLANVPMSGNAYAPPRPERRKRIHVRWLVAAAASVAIVSTASYLMLHRGHPLISRAVTTGTIDESKAVPASEPKKQLESPSAATPSASEPNTTSARMGDVVISANLPGVQVLSDGGPLGITDRRGEFAFQKEAGTYSIRMKKSGFQDSQMSIVVRQGRVVRVRTLLSPVPVERTASVANHPLALQEKAVGSSQPTPPIAANTSIPESRTETPSNRTPAHLPPPPDIQTQTTPQNTTQMLPTNLPALVAPPNTSGSIKPGTPSVAMVANARGVALVNAGNYADAIARFNDALQANPDFEAAYVNRGVAYQYLGKYQQAIADYSRALSLNPTNSKAAELKKEAEHKKNKGVEGLGSGATRPVLLSPIPVLKYTKEAVKAGVKGTVMLDVTVDEQGVATDIIVLKSLGYGLDEAAIRAVKNAKFRPAEKDGQPVKFAVNLEVKFKDR